MPHVFGLLGIGGGIKAPETRAGGRCAWHHTDDQVLSSRPVLAPEIGIYTYPIGKIGLAGGASNTGCGVLAARPVNGGLQSGLEGGNSDLVADVLQF